METYARIINFWIDTLNEDDWFKKNSKLDKLILDEFFFTWRRACENNLDFTPTTPQKALAFIILTDQFPRRMFKDKANSFQSDNLARSVAKKTINMNFDLRISEPQRKFFYFPLMHSESLSDQERCVRLMLTRMPKTYGKHIKQAKAHRQIIRSFGRFPFRNEVLSRTSKISEQFYLKFGGINNNHNELSV